MLIGEQIARVSPSSRLPFNRQSLGPAVTVNRPWGKAPCVCRRFSYFSHNYWITLEEKIYLTNIFGYRTYDVSHRETRF